MKKQHMALAGAVILALLGVAALVSYANGADERAFAGTKMVAVLRATADVPANTSVDDLADKTQVVKVPKAAVVPGALNNLGDAGGQVTTTAMVPGDQVTSVRLAAPEKVKGAAALPKGTQELAIPLSGARLVGGAVAAGDKLGVFISYDGQTANPINDLLVLKVDAGDAAAAGKDAGTVITVAVKTLTAEKLVHGMEFGKVWLSKQSSDTDTSGGKTITQKDVAP